MPTTLQPGAPAPEFVAQVVRCGAIVDDFSLNDALRGFQYLLLVFYQADFTFVCPTEIVQFTEKFAEFAQHQCNVVCCSTDSVYTHLAWLKSPKSERGLGAPDSGSIVLLSDRSHEISRAYGVLAASGAAYRGTFLLDKYKTIWQVTINDMPVGRSIDEALRTLEGLCHSGAIQKAPTEGAAAADELQPGTEEARPEPLEPREQHQHSHRTLAIDDHLPEVPVAGVVVARSLADLIRKVQTVESRLNRIEAATQLMPQSTRIEAAQSRLEGLRRSFSALSQLVRMLLPILRLFGILYQLVRLLTYDS